jgi:hypothetical protein
MKPTISAEAISLAKDHPFAQDENFMISLSEELASLHYTASLSERIALFNRVTTTHLKRVDKENIALARSEGAQEERRRIRAILEAPEAEGREEVARSLAFESEMPVEAALAGLKVAPRKSSVWSSEVRPAAKTLPDSGALRTADAPGGLLVMGANGQAEAAKEPPVRFDSSMPLNREERTKAMWREVIGKINAEAAGNAK